MSTTTPNSLIMEPSPPSSTQTTTSDGQISSKILQSGGFINKYFTSLYQQSSSLLSSIQLQKTLNYCCLRARELLFWAFLEPLVPLDVYEAHCERRSHVDKKTREERFRPNKFLFMLAYQARIRIPFIITSLFLLFNLPMVRIEIDIDINVNNNR